MMDALTVANAGAWFAQVACLVAAAALAAFALRLDAPGVRFTYWRIVLAVSIVLPWLQGRVDPTATSPTITGAAGTLSGPQPFGAGGVAASATPADWVAIALAAALVGTALRLVWVGLGILRLRRWRDAGVSLVPLPLQDLQSVVGKSADIRFVPELDHPVTFGVVRPVVLLPSALLEQPLEIQRAVLAHELIHVERRDWAWLLAEEFVRAMFWFHPAVWWLISRVQLAREEVVDELAVLVTGSRRSYVEALLTFADRDPLSTAPAFARRRHLFRRMLLISREAAMSSRQVVASCAVMALIVIIGAHYAVAAFPLQGSGGRTVRMEAGPLEKRANPITPENPIPRRISHVDPDLPNDAMTEGLRVNVTVRATIDASGRVAEVRPVAVGWEAITRAAGSPNPPDWEPHVILSTVHAVRQWQYDPPYQAPLAFDVTVRFGADPPPPPPPPPPAPPAPRLARPGAPEAPPPPPPPPPPPDQFARPAVRVGFGGITAPVKTWDVRPIYPPIAMAARVQGVVILETHIEADGTVSSARVLRSIPLLDRAAIDAVRQWQFTPTLLNGSPIPVIMTTTVEFRLE